MKKFTPEGIIKRQICFYLKSKGIFFWLNHSTGVYDPVAKRFRINNSPFFLRGTSDIIGCLNDGRFLAIEVKSKTGKPTKEQIEFIEKINSLGGLAFIAHSVDDVMVYL
jgi:hypothetical protein